MYVSACMYTRTYLMYKYTKCSYLSICVADETSTKEVEDTQVRCIA
ncbi:hypothetical protein CSUI_006969 [Cystoisospora suis]|uniref:Uncharacterized protein n=1 Tax=Cystoisospora suis TaxID=483139 RepID=A0A2C6JXI3_9APIC|nr:hypothetical protein CSUI_006969 [Cystoisospora suis]